METAIVIIGAALIILIVVAVSIVFIRKYKRHRLKSRFGPEYSRVIQEAGGKTQLAEARLEQRAQRVESYNIHPLTAADSDRYRRTWHSVQTQFADDPKGAVTAADELLTEVMSARGYPVADFDQRSADLSVDHPVVVQNYRMAHEIAGQHARGKASTEDLRQAMLCYRALFDELVGKLEDAAVQN